MKAVGYLRSLPVDDERSLFDFETDVPRPEGRDLLVEVQAISVNPLDAVQRMRKEPVDGTPVVLGWDVAGIVSAVGSEVRFFEVGDHVFLSGDLRRPGGNAEYLLADERVVAAKPASLSFAEAASLPLTAITAWEALFDRLRVPVGPGSSDDRILLIGAAGGVGSIALQLLKARTALEVIATASRPESRDWLARLGADVVLDHSQPLMPQFAQAGISSVRYAFPLSHTLQHWPTITGLLAPEGEVVVVDNPVGIDATALRAKAGALHFEMMWIKLLAGGERQLAIRQLLQEVAELVDAGRIRPTANADFGTICAVNLRRAHRAIETGKTVGKITLSGFVR